MCDNCKKLTRELNQMRAINLVLWTIIGGVFFLLATMPARALTLNWENPTQYEDGSALTLQEFQRFDFSCSTTQGDRSIIQATWIETDATRVLDDSLFQRGVTLYCSLRVAVMGTKTGGQIVASDWSNEVNFSLPPLRPNAPTNLEATP